METYRIHATLHNESRNGDVWNYTGLSSRLIKIYNKKNKKSIIVVNRPIEKNYERIYNIIGSKRWFVSKIKNSIVIDEYYRTKLGVRSAEDALLKITKAKYLWQHLRYLKQHPNDVVRITYYLAVWSVIIGAMIAVITTIISLG